MYVHVSPFEVLTFVKQEVLTFVKQEKLLLHGVDIMCQRSDTNLECHYHDLQMHNICATSTSSACVHVNSCSFAYTHNHIHCKSNQSEI